jgi:hypothetical protein
MSGLARLTERRLGAGPNLRRWSSRDINLNHNKVTPDKPRFEPSFKNLWEVEESDNLRTDGVQVVS